MEGGFGVCSAEDGDEVIFERLDGPFSGIATMDVWGHQLEVNAFFADCVFESSGCLVVELLQLWVESLVNKILMQFVVCLEVFGVGAVFHGFGQNGVTIIIVEYE